ncbi:MAG: polysaccharide pyruvyl transferase family protein [Oscillospiraceae bacterium]
MKIGIISMQRIYNYGSFMQSYALKRLVESLGHDVVFVDIKPGRQLEPVKRDTISKIKLLFSKLDRYALKRIEHHYQDKKMFAIFKQVLKDELGVDAFIDNEHCDVVIIGSDEVFNCTQVGKPFGFTSHLFGDEVNAEKVISYAASFGHTNMDDLKKYRIDEEVGQYLRNFSAISVRDKNSLELVKQLSGIEAFEHMDPVIVGDFDDRIPKPRLRDYIAVYAYGNRIKTKEEINAIKEFARKRNKKLVAVGMYQMWCDINVVGTPFEIVGYIKHADFVITDTFHGCVFSIKYQKQFAAFVRESNRNKLTDLLSRFALDDRIISSVEFLENVVCKPMDKDKIKNRINEETKRSTDYLLSQLKLNQADK